jgi:hypothetical protein
MVSSKKNSTELPRIEEHEFPDCNCPVRAQQSRELDS